MNRLASPPGDFLLLPSSFHVPASPSPRFVCPGSDVPITAAVHAARLAAGDRRCRGCAFGEAGPAGSVLAVEGETIRGRYGEAVTAASAERIGFAFGLRLSEAGRPGKPVAVACGEGVFGPAVVDAVGRGLRSAGVDTADLGRVPATVWSFGAAHLDAAGGVFVSCDGGDGATVTLEFAEAAARPIDAESGLKDLAASVASPLPARPTRRGGAATAFDAAVPYQAGLWRHFRHVRAGRVLCRCTSSAVGDVARRLAAGLPFELRVTAGGAFDADRFGKAVRDAGADLGVAITADGRAGRVFGPDGTEIIPVETAATLSRLGEVERSGPGVVDWDLVDRLGGGRSDRLVPAVGSPRATAVAMADHRAEWGLDAAGRCWVADPAPRADFLFALPRLIAAVGLARIGGRPAA